MNHALFTTWPVDEPCALYEPGRSTTHFVLIKFSCVKLFVQVQQQGRQRAEALAERSVEIAQAMVPLAGALARGGG